VIRNRPGLPRHALHRAVSPNRYQANRYRTLRNRSQRFRAASKISRALLHPLYLPSLLLLHPQPPSLHSPHIVPQHVCIRSVEEPCCAPFLFEEARKGRRSNPPLPSRLMDCKSIEAIPSLPSNGSCVSGLQSFDLA
jgi:hypothetical protein